MQYFSILLKVCLDRSNLKIDTSKRNTKEKKSKMAKEHKNKKVRNIKGTSSCLPKGNTKSWKQLHKKKTPSARQKDIEKCAIKYCRKPSKVGAHVETKNSTLSILNLCRSHNHPSKDRWMSIKNTANLVKLTKDVAGGKSKCYRR